MELGSKSAFAHQDSIHVGPHDDGEAEDLHGNQLSNRHHFVVHHPVPLHILHQNREGLQVGALQPAAFGECVGTGALEVISSPVKRQVMGVTRGVAHTLTNRVAFLDAILYLALLIRATREILTHNLIKIEQ